MLDQQFFDELSDKIARLLPRAGELGAEAKSALKQMLQKSFDELNLLTQEAFESRVRALERTEQRVAELERTIAELEQKFHSLSQSEPRARPDQTN